MGLLKYLFGGKKAVTSPTVVPPKESAEQLLKRIRVRGERHKELDTLIVSEKLLPTEKRTLRMSELQKAVFDAIESDANMRDYRVPYYQYQATLFAAKAGR